MATLVHEVMTGPVCTLSEEATALEAARLMRDEGTGDVVVAGSAGEVVGIVTDRDLALRLLADERPLDTRLSDLMSGELVTVAPDARLDQAAALMAEHAVRRLPVCDNGSAVGFVSLGDLALVGDPGSVLADISAAPSQE